MSINRREFLKTLGVASAGVAGLPRRVEAHTTDSQGEFYAILHDISLCEGCQECEFACAEANGLPGPTDDDYPDPEITRDTTPEKYTVINAVNTSRGEFYTKTQCRHCAQPACASACLTQAMKKHAEGPVTWESGKCMGCRYCMVSCPFDLPRFEFDSNNPQIGKCQMCFERLKEGEIPACVENCPAGALSFGTRTEMIHLARKRILENPNEYVDHIYGEHEAGGTSWLNISPVPFKELGYKTNLESKPYPELTKGFLYSVPSIFILWPALLFGIRQSTGGQNSEEDDHE